MFSIKSEKQSVKWEIITTWNRKTTWDRATGLKLMVIWTKAISGCFIESEICFILRPQFVGNLLFCCWWSHWWITSSNAYTQFMGSVLTWFQINWRSVVKLVDPISFIVSVQSLILNTTCNEMLVAQISVIMKGISEATNLFVVHKLPDIYHTY